MSVSVSVVIVNYNSGPHLASCLDALVQHMPDVVWDACVVDNASTDGSEGAAERCGARATLIRNPENVGFARAANQGIAGTSGELVLLMNPDCRLLAGAVETLIQEMSRGSTWAVVGPRLVDGVRGLQGSARGDPDMLTGLFGRSSTLTRWFPRSPLARKNVVVDEAILSDQSAAVVDWVSGACVLARRTALEAIGAFDERYFMYWEDADLCRRLRRRDYRIAYVPAATVVHVGGQSSASAQALAVRAFHESAYTYYTTHVAPGEWNPKRALAWLILQARCWWKLRKVFRPKST